MNRRHHPLTRRTVLRGLGVTMALPWLESIPAFAEAPKAPVGSSSDAPQRLAVLFAGNGFHSREWWAKGSGKDMELGQVLAPLQPHTRKNCYLCEGYTMKRLSKETFTASIDRQSAVGSTARIRRRDSVRHQLRPDHCTAQRGPPQSCPVWCLVAKKPTHRCTRITRCYTARTSRGVHLPRRHHSKCIRHWRSDRLFSNDTARGDKSVLDAILADAKDMRRKISTSDQHKVDEYLNSVREIERRIESAGKRGELQGWRPTLEKPNIPRATRGLSTGYRRTHASHVRHPCARVPDRHHAGLHTEAE